MTKSKVKNTLKTTKWRLGLEIKFSPPTYYSTAGVTGKNLRIMENDNG